MKRTFTEERWALFSSSPSGNGLPKSGSLSCYVHTDKVLSGLKLIRNRRDGKITGSSRTGSSKISPLGRGKGSFIQSGNGTFRRGVSTALSPLRPGRGTGYFADGRTLIFLKDPAAAPHIEDLIHELAGGFTMAIVTHNMQQSVRISYHTAFFLMGKMIEYGETQNLFTNPKDEHTKDYITGKFG